MTSPEIWLSIFVFPVFVWVTVWFDDPVSEFEDTVPNAMDADTLSALRVFTSIVCPVFVANPVAADASVVVAATYQIPAVIPGEDASVGRAGYQIWKPQSY
jgi:hypothetical protein